MERGGGVVGAGRKGVYRVAYIVFPETQLTQPIIARKVQRRKRRRRSEENK